MTTKKIAKMKICKDLHIMNSHFISSHYQVPRHMGTHISQSYESYILRRSINNSHENQYSDASKKKRRTDILPSSLLTMLWSNSSWYSTSTAVKMIS